MQTGWALGFVIVAALAGCDEGSERRHHARIAPNVAAASPLASPPEPFISGATVASVEVDLNPQLLRRFKPLTGAIDDPSRPLTTARIELGKRLFFDTKLSRGNDVSCNSCHVLTNYGVDGRRTSVGHRGQEGVRNAPTVYNAAAAFAQFWDGRAKTIEDQAKTPILNPSEMGMTSEAEVVVALKSERAYGPRFAAAFPGESDPVTFANAASAIGAFERTLVTPSRWDAFLAGDANALTPAEKRGLKTFLSSGCMVCHTGPLLGGSMFQRAGAVEAWPNQADTGRMAVSKNEQDRMMFKVPTLRNIEKTAPYFHDGSAKTLEEAIAQMGRYQLGVQLDAADVQSIATWMKSLTGQLPAGATAANDP